MRIVSIDIETTGLVADRHQVIEVGAVVDDLRVQKPLDELPRFHAYILPPRSLDGSDAIMGLSEGEDYVGQPYALQMNQRILERIAKREEGYTYLDPSTAHLEFREWCMREGLFEEHDFGNGYSGPRVKFVAAGKNYAGFDRPFLERWLQFGLFRIHHRVADPAMLFLDPAHDDVPPDLKTCLERAGIVAEVTHEAVDDAMLVVKLLRAAFPLVDGVPTRRVFQCLESTPTP